MDEPYQKEEFDWKEEFILYNKKSLIKKEDLHQKKIFCKRESSKRKSLIE